MAGRQTNVERKATELRRGLGSDLATIRRDAGIPMVRLAAATGISRAHLWDIEAGRAEASTEVLVRLSDAPWPGSALMWAIVDKGQARIMDRPPRGLLVGR